LSLGPTDDLDDLLRGGHMRVVKQGAHRTVYRIDVAAGEFYLKHHRASAWWSSLRCLFRASAPCREYRKALELARRRISVVVPVALGRRWHGAWSADEYLLTAAIPQAVSLEEFAAVTLPQLPIAVRLRVRRKLIRALAAMTADAHRAGALHDDMHSGNLLIEADVEAMIAGQMPRLHWADVPGVVLTRCLSWARSRDNLAALNWDWMRRATPIERRRFLAIYRRRRTDLDLRREAAPSADIARSACRYGFKVMASRDKRCLANNRDFHSGRIADARWWAVRDIAPEDVSRLAAAFAQGAPGESLRLDGRSIEIRRYQSTGKLWSRWTSDRGARRAWHRAHALLARLIPTPRPLILVIPTRKAATRASCLVYETQTVERLDQVVDKLICESSVCDQLGKVGQLVGRLLGQLHVWRYFDDQLRSDDILIETIGDRDRAVLANPMRLAIARDADRQRPLKSLSAFVAALAPDHWRALNAESALLAEYARQWEIDVPDVSSLGCR
jgi:hypothetical protein